MKYKKGLIFICLVICLFSIASVCASDVNETIMASEDQSDELITIDDSGTTEEGALSESSGTFTELAAKINNGTEIVLDKDYRFDSAVDTDYQMGVGISKTITLDGKGHTIDGNNGAKLLRITGNNVILKNLIFINSYSDSTHTVGAVSLEGNSILDNCSFMNINVKYGDSALSASNSIIKNCYFLNNHARDGSTVSLSSSVDIINCTFINNTGSRGGAIITRSGPNNIINCDFINNSAENAGAISIFYSSLNNIINCSFSNNKGVGVSAISVAGVANNIENCSFANNEGADIVAFSSFPSSDDSKLINCYFVNNTSIDDYIENGIVRLMAFDCLVFNCSFINNTAKNSKAYSTTASAICVTGSEGNVSNCFFSGNYAERGGAIYWTGNDGSMSNCIFVNNVASEYAGAIYWTGENGNINNCIFLNNTPENSYSDSVTVIKKKLRIICSDYSFYYNHLNPIFIKLGDVLQNVPVDSTLSLNFVKDDVDLKFNVPLVNNTASIFDEISDLTVGVWTVTAIFEGDDNYDSCNVTFTVTINPTKSYIFVNDVNGTWGKQIILIANILDYDKLLINEGIVTFFDGETNIGQTNVKEGVASLGYTPTIAGEHTITAIFNSDNYQSSNDVAKLFVDTASIEVIANTGIVGYNSNFVANVKGLYSIINEGSVAFYVNDDFIGKSNVVNGVASLVYAPLSAGNFILKAIYDGGDKFLKTESSTNYIVSQADSQIVIDNVTGTIYHELMLTSRISSSNNLTINEGTVTFSDNGNVIGATIVKDGVASLSYTPTTAGEHTITAKFISDNYKSSANTSTLFVYDPDAHLTFTDLANLINKDKSEITLENDVVYNSSIDSDYQNGIEISKTITLDGKGHYVDGNNLARIFIINSPTTLMNIKFINGYVNGYCGAISSTSPIVLINCTFIHTVASYSGAINLCSNSKIINCSFINNSAKHDGGAIGVGGDNCTISDCEFVNNNADSYEGAIRITGNNCTISDCKFINNSAGIAIGAISCYGDNISVINCDFINNSAISIVSYGGAVAWFGKYGNLVNSSFINNNGENIIHWSDDSYKSNMVNCTLINNSGSITWKGDYGFLSNCSLSDEGGQLFVWSGDYGIISNTDFANTLKNYNTRSILNWKGVNGAIINSSFTNNKLTNETYLKLQDVINHDILIIQIEVKEDSTIIKVTRDDGNAVDGVHILVNLMDINLNEIDFEGSGSPYYDENYLSENSVLYNSYIMVTDSKGECELSFPFLKAGTYIISVEVDDTRYDVGNVAKGIFVVKKTVISAPTVNTVYNGGKYLVATLNSNGKALSGFDLVIKFNGKKYIRTTDAKGQVKISTNALDPKTYKATIDFEGIKNYAMSSATTKVIVKKATPKLTAKAKTFKVKDKIKKYTVTLKTNKNVAMKNTKITLKVNGKTYSAKTNNKGVATFKLTKLTKKGKYAALVKFAGNKYYTAKTVKPKITVK